MTEDDYWRIIKDARSFANGDVEFQAQLIATSMGTRSVPELNAFNSWVRQRMHDATLTDLLLVVSWVYDVHDLGPVSGDGWEYWRGWLVSRGKEEYMAALRNADVVAEYFTDIDDFLGGESIEYSAMYAYELATGSRGAPEEMYDASLIELWLVWWKDEDETAQRLRERFPKMAAKFGLPSFAR